MYSVTCSSWATNLNRHQLGRQKIAKLRVKQRVLGIKLRVKLRVLDIKLRVLIGK